MPSYFPASGSARSPTENAGASPAASKCPSVRCCGNSRDCPPRYRSSDGAHRRHPRPELPCIPVSGCERPTQSRSYPARSRRRRKQLIVETVVEIINLQILKMGRLIDRLEQPVAQIRICPHRPAAIHQKQELRLVLSRALHDELQTSAFVTGLLDRFLHIEFRFRSISRQDKRRSFLSATWNCRIWITASSRKSR